MTNYLEISLASSTCFSSGTGFAGEVDIDIEQEREFGLPMIRGKTIKGLLVEECALILKVLERDIWKQAADRLFGAPKKDEGAVLLIGNAGLPEGFRKTAINAVKRPVNPVPFHMLLHSLTEIRNQTKINAASEAPEKHSLRKTRLALSDLTFQAPLVLQDSLKAEEKALLAGCVLATRRGGLNRNRGWGRLKMQIHDQQDQDVTQNWFQPLRDALGGSCNE